MGMDIFRKFDGREEGRKEGEALRLAHETGRRCFWTGKRLAKEAERRAKKFAWDHMVTGTPDCETNFLHAFLQAYTNTRLLREGDLSIFLREMGKE